MSKINYHRKDNWKIKPRKPPKTHRAKDIVKFERRKVKQLIHEFINELHSSSLKSETPLSRIK